MGRFLFKGRAYLRAVHKWLLGLHLPNHEHGMHKTAMRMHAKKGDKMPDKHISLLLQAVMWRAQSFCGEWHARPGSSRLCKH